jgi:FkbM family methyltransferase
MLRKHLGSLYKRLIRMFAYPYQVYRRQGAYFLLNQHSFMDEGLIKFKPYETDLIAQAEAIIARHGITHFYDIGANLGYYTVLLGQQPQITTVRSFEPFPALQLQIGSNVLINGLVDKWRGFQCALGDSKGEAELFYHPFWLGTSSLDKDWVQRSEYSIRVDVHTFDSLVDTRGERCFVKIDVEGLELSVLAGMQGFLRNNTVFLQIETTGERAAQVEAVLHEAGYRPAGRASGADLYFSNFPDEAGAAPQP